ncbi:hypothetical protein Tco_1158829 [Tanacetum coccineum]
MTLTATNWNSTVHHKVRKALETNIVLIVIHIEARLFHFEQEFMKEAAIFLREYKSLEKEVGESLEKVKSFEKENDRLLEAVKF